MIRVLPALAAALMPLTYYLPNSARQAWMVLIAIWLIAQLIPRGQRDQAYSTVWPTTAYLLLLASLASGANSKDPGDHWTNSVTLIFMWTITPRVFSLSRIRKSLGPAAIGFVASQSVSALVAFLQFTGGLFLGPRGLFDGRASGLNGHPNILGLLSGVVCVMLANRALTASHKGLSWLVIFLNLGGLLAGGSMSSLMATTVGVVLLLIGLRVSPFKIILAVLILVSGFAYLGYATNGAISTDRILSRAAQTTGQTSKVGTLLERLDTVTYAQHRIRESPVYGVGLDDESGTTPGQGIVVHSLPVRAWFQGGFPLAIAITLIYVSCGCAIARAIKANTAATSAAVCATFLVFACTSASFQQLYFWLPLIICWTSLRAELRPPIPQLDTQPRFRVHPPPVVLLGQHRSSSHDLQGSP